MNDSDEFDDQLDDGADDPVVERLRAAFARHEADADPDVARGLVPTSVARRRSRWAALLAAAAVLALVAGLGLAAARDHDAAPGPGSPTSPGAPTSTVGGNGIPAPAGTDRKLAMARAAQEIARFPVPPGAEERSSAPAPGLRRLGADLEPMDPTLTRTRWWVVPTSAQAVVDFYLAHTPARSEGDNVLYWSLGRDTDAYTGPSAVVAYVGLSSDSTAIRADVTLAALHDRTAATLVPSTVTRLTVTDTILGAGPTDRPPVRVTDPAAIARVVSAFDALPGGEAGSLPGCGSPVGITHLYAVTFHWPDHTLAVDTGMPLCGRGRGLTRDGRKLTQTVRDSDRLEAALRAAYRGR